MERASFETTPTDLSLLQNIKSNFFSVEEKGEVAAGKRQQKVSHRQKKRR